MDYKQWIKEVQIVLIENNHNFPVDENSAEFKQDFEDGLSPEESALIALSDWNDEF